MEGKAAGESVIEGEVERVVFESDDGSFRVIRVHPDTAGARDPKAGETRRGGGEDVVTVVGSFPRVAPGVRVRIHGSLTHDKRFGEQIRADSVTEVAPSTLKGIERYLGSGMIKGIGATSARRIVTHFGLDTLRVLDEELHRLDEVGGLGAKRIASIAAAWQEHRALREMMVFLQAHGASPALATRIWKRYGARAVAIVSSDPYRLSLDVRGVGFKTADRIASSLGIEPDAPTRLQSGLLQCVQDASDSGHVFIMEDELLDSTAALLGFPPQEQTFRAKLVQAGAELQRAGHVRVERGGEPGAAERTANEPKAIYATALYDAEVRVAERLGAMARVSVRRLGGAEKAVTAFEKDAGSELAPEQRAAVEAAAISPVVIVTGGPGVGKTTVVRAILAVLQGQKIDVRLAAPTGRAAKRMTEATGHEALTLHRLLEFDPKFGTFRRTDGRPLEVGALIVDEASMIDLPMADALVAALWNANARLILVGDVDQLPSVGPGAVLRELIASGAVPTVRLTRIFRQAQSSLIVTNAHRINAGQPPVLPPPGVSDADFFVIDRRDPEAAKATILELVTSRIPKRFGFDPIADIQVLAPMHKGPAGAIALNEALQAALNPRTEAVQKGRRSFRVGDKVMQLRNDYDRSVWNGDVGIILRIDWEDELVVVGFDPKPNLTNHDGAAGSGAAAAYEREIVYDGRMLDDLTLAYACSVHKAQGSEYPAVVIPFLKSHFVMLTKNLLYTAMTRGKRLVVLVADPAAIRTALGAARNDERRTWLARRLSRAASSWEGGDAAVSGGAVGKPQLGHS